MSQSGTKEPKKEGSESKGGSGAGSNAKEGYQPGSGEKPENTTDDAATRGIDKNGFQADGKKGGTADASSGDGANGAPAKYKGFWEKYAEELRKRTKNAPK